jgi:phosphoglycolate phosphatase-like HAD superfamily hydrolase
MKLIVFDFDGTLVDSRKLIWEAHRHRQRREFAARIARAGAPVPGEAVETIFTRL